MQAKLHADVRKVGAAQLTCNEPVRAQPPLMLEAPGFQATYSTYPEVYAQTHKLPTWRHNGKFYTVEDLRKQLAQERSLVEAAKVRGGSDQKPLHRAMVEVKAQFEIGTQLRKRGWEVVPNICLVKPSAIVVEPRRRSVRVWQLSEQALEYAQRDAERRRPSVRVNSFLLQGDEMDWENDTAEVDPDKFEMPSMEDFNATPNDHFTKLLKASPLDLLHKLKGHVTRERSQKRGVAEPEKWQILMDAISQAHQDAKSCRNQKGKNRNGHGNMDRSDGRQQNNRAHAGGQSKPQNSGDSRPNRVVKQGYQQRGPRPDRPEHNRAQDRGQNNGRNQGQRPKPAGSAPNQGQRQLQGEGQGQGQRQRQGKRSNEGKRQGLVIEHAKGFRDKGIRHHDKKKSARKAKLSRPKSGQHRR
jgi:hypothetical protein